MASTVSSTNLSFGLVSCPVSVKKVADKAGVEFKSCSPDGHAVKQMYRDEETGELYEPSALEKAVETAEGLALVGKDNVKAINESGKIDGVAIDYFIPRDDLPSERIEGTYFLAPAKKAGPAEKKPLALLRDGLRAHGKAGIGKLTLRSKQRAFVVYEEDGGLLLSTLVFADDFAQVAEASDCLADVPEADGKTLNLFGTLIASMEGERSDLDAYADDTIEVKRDLVEKVLGGEKIEAPVVEKAAPVTDNIEELLLASVAEAQPKGKKKAA